MISESKDSRDIEIDSLKLLLQVRESELREARDTNQRLNRRVQSAEKRELRDGMIRMIKYETYLILHYINSAIYQISKKNDSKEAMFALTFAKSAYDRIWRFPGSVMGEEYIRSRYKRLEDANNLNKDLKRHFIDFSKELQSLLVEVLEPIERYYKSDGLDDLDIAAGKIRLFLKRTEEIISTESNQ